MPTPERCFCGTGEVYSSCCGRLHAGQASAATAEALMRSRFSAFAIRDVQYLLATWHPRTRPKRLDLDPATEWTRLEIVSARGGPFDREGAVEFRAHYRVPLPGGGGSDGVLSELSSFVRTEGQWLYVDGVVEEGSTRRN